MSNDYSSIRINSARMAEYKGRTVRLVCKTITMNNDSMSVETSDGGQVTVIMPGRLPEGVSVESSYIEIIGKVENPSQIKMLSCVNLGEDLDMQLVNDTIELTHDPRWFSKIFEGSAEP